jgi:alpha-tubulin suppressor-like RCC1 family protein
VPVDTGVEKVAAGTAHSIYVKNDRSLWAMGHNNQRQVDPSGINRETPVLAGGSVKHASGGGSHTIVILSGE